MADTKGQESAWAHLPFPEPWECNKKEWLDPETSKRDLGGGWVSHVCANFCLQVASAAAIPDTQMVFVLFKASLVD